MTVSVIKGNKSASRRRNYAWRCVESFVCLGLLSLICSAHAVEMIRVGGFSLRNLLTCYLSAAVGASVCFITETDNGNKR